VHRSRLAATLIATLACAGTPTPEAPTEPPPRSGREAVARALVPPQVQPHVFARSGVLATVWSSLSLASKSLLKSLDPRNDHRLEPFELEFSDGTRVGGTLFRYEHDGPTRRPLVIASFGFLQDRWGSEAGKVYDLYMNENDDALPIDLLVLDHPTSGPFLASNGNLSVGSYDDARMWLEVAQHLERELRPSSIHAIGVSMSGQTVVHALAEDDRLGLGVFDSGLAVSIAPDFRIAPGRQLARLPTRDGVENPWRSALEPGEETTINDELQEEALWRLVDQQFVPNYHRLRRDDFSLEREDVAVFFRQAYEQRLAHLRRNPTGPGPWDGERVRLEGLEAYMKSTRTANVVGRVRTPLVLLSARDDPAVFHEMFHEVLAAAAHNPWIVAYETEHGGHFGFDVAYGKRYLDRIVNLLFDPEVIRRWLPETESADAPAPAAR